MAGLQHTALVSPGEQEARVHREGEAQLRYTHTWVPIVVGSGRKCRLTEELSTGFFFVTDPLALSNNDFAWTDSSQISQVRKKT